jgi:hypothetical protein
MLVSKRMNPIVHFYASLSPLSKLDPLLSSPSVAGGFASLCARPMDFLHQSVVRSEATGHRKWTKSALIHETRIPV